MHYLTVCDEKGKPYIQGVFKKRPNFCYKDFILQHFKHCPLQSSPSTGNTPFPMFIPLLDCFLERIFCDGVEFSYRIFLNLRVHKLFVRLIRRTACAHAQFSGCSSMTNAHSEMGQMVVCCQNLLLGAVSSRSAGWCAV
jgi:hypothetical protein